MPKAIITGAAGGIGKSLCEYFHDKGYEVIGIDKIDIHDNLPYKIFNFDLSLIGTQNSGCCMFYEEIGNLLKDELNVLINNAAVQVVKKVEDITQEDWDTTLAVNLLAPFWLIQRFYPLLKKNRGSIVNIASIHAYLTKAEFSLYATSKGALVTMTKALALEMAPDVRVNAIIPAATDTSMLRAGFKGKSEFLKLLGDYHPLKRIAKPREIAEVAYFLANDKSSFITGSAINVDGGIGAVLHDPVI